MSVKRCCVPKCTDNEGRSKVLHLFPNPENEVERFRRWVSIIGGDILGLSNEDIFKHRRVCHSHFEEKYCCRNNRISSIAVPTLLIPGPLFWRQLPTRPLSEIQNMPSTSQGNIVAVKPDTSVKNIENLECALNEKVGTRYQSSHDSLHQFRALNRLQRTYRRANTSRKGQNIQVNTKGDVVMMEVVTNAVEEIDCALVDKADDTATVDNKPLMRDTRDIQKPDSHTEKKQDECDQLKKQKRVKTIKMTTNEKSIYQKLLVTRTKLAKFRSKLKKQSSELKLAQNFLTNPKFQNIINNLPTASRTLTLLQFREYKKKEKGRRFSLKEKILALALLKQSPKAYRFLRKLFILPSSQVLTRLLHKADVQAGINESVFRQLKKRATKMLPHEKICVLLFNEMSLKAHVAYNQRKDCVIGFVNNGEDITSEIADHALVFMIRGLVYNYRLPVAYTFAQAATKGPELARQIKAVIKNLLEAGLEVCATICDQGSNNRHAIKLLCEETRGDLLRRCQEVDRNENIIIVNNKKIVPLYDPPHLLKGIRNNLITKNLKFLIEDKEKTAKWDHIMLMHKHNNIYRGMTLIPKLTDSHVIPEKIPKMKVKYASQVFSRSLAVHMGFYAEKGILPAECEDTSDILLFFDDLFDSVNGSFTGDHIAKPLQGPVTPASPHEAKWAESIKILKSMKFEGKAYVPTIDGWVWTLEGLQKLIKYLKDNYNVSSVWMRHLNQDQLENFFGSIRSHGYRNTNPTPEKFESAFASLLINRLTSVHSPSANCEVNDCETLFALVISKGGKASSSNNLIPPQLEEITLTPLSEKNRPQIMGPLQYMAGYFLKKIKTKTFKSCKKCKSNLCTEDELEYIKYREYGGGRWLCYPDIRFITCISNLQDIISNLINKNLHIPNLKEFIKTMILMHLDFDFIECSKHREKIISFLINFVTTFFLYNYCKRFNKVMAGKENIENDEGDMLQKAKIYALKAFKRRK